MNRRNKIITLLASVLISATLLQQAHATLIDGSIAFKGGALADNSDLTKASQISFYPASVTPTTVIYSSGDFGGLTGSGVAMYSPLIIDPPTPPAGALWSVGGFSLILDSLEVDYVGQTALALYGTGTLYGAGFEPTAGEWFFGLTTSGGQEATFSWASLTSSSGEPGQSVPDGGSTAMLLGCGLVLLGFLSRSRAQRA